MTGVERSVTPSLFNRTVTIDVRGRPRPQGSVTQWKLPNGSTATKYRPEVYAWRAQMLDAIQKVDADPFTGPVEVQLDFVMPRLRGHFGTGKNAGIVKATAPTYPTVAPDIDKLARAVLDSVTDAGLWRDDAQVALLVARKRYDGLPGVLITISDLA